MIYLSVVYPRGRHFSLQPLSTASAPSSTGAELIVEYIYYTAAEREQFAKEAHDYLIEQTQLGPHTPPFAYPPVPGVPVAANSFDSGYAPAFSYSPVSTHPTPLETWKKKMHEKVQKQIGGKKQQTVKPLAYTIREEWETGDPVTRMRSTRLPSKKYTRLPRRRRRLDP